MTQSSMPLVSIKKKKKLAKTPQSICLQNSYLERRMAAHILEPRSCASLSSITALRPSFACFYARLVLPGELSLEPATVRAFRHKSKSATE